MTNATKVFLLVLVGTSGAAQRSWGQATGQGSGQDQGAYQGVSHPPSDDTITTSIPQEAKPPAGHPMNQVQQRQQAYPAYPSSTGTAQQRVGTLPMADRRDGTDDGLVGVAPNAQDPRLAMRATDAMRTADPDGDIVHPEALMRPGMLAGSMGGPESRLGGSVNISK